LSGCQTYCVF